MGYSEDHCQICGVGFNIARIRKATGGIDGKLEEPKSAAWSYFRDGSADDFVEVSDSARAIVEECGPNAGCMYIDQAEEKPPISPWKPGESEDPDDVAARLPPDEAPHEHLAGSGCQSAEGYNGHNISVEEIRGSRVVQCLVRKTSDFLSADDDEVFETSGDWFLSGLSDGLPEAAERGSMEVVPSRHGVSEPDAWNTIDPGNAEEIAMPFHPYCLEVYKRVAKLRYGDIDIAGLMQWYERESDWDLFHQFPRDGPVKWLQQQWWEHRPGTEWVVSNPLSVPALPQVLESAISTDPYFNASSGAFEAPQDFAGVPSNDPFSGLPRELQLLILANLPSKSVASLRLVSRSFRQLPISLWHDFIKREMPWLWEASDVTSFPYSFWADKTQDDFINGPHDEYKPSDFTPLPVRNILPPTKTNWYLLYLNITKDWENLKGLQNRKRIWTDCEEIVRRIAKYRKNGEIPIQDLTAFVQQRQDERIRKRDEATEMRMRLRMAGQGGAVVHDEPA